MRGRLRLVRALGLTALVFSLTANALAQDAPAPGPAPGEELPIDLVELAKERRESMFFTPMSQRVGRYLAKAAEKMDEGDLSEARRLLLKLNLKRLNKFERANVYRMIAYISYSLGDQKQALDAFESAIAEEALLLKDDVSVMFNVVQLHAAQEEWPLVIEKLDRWTRYVPEPTGLSWYLRAAAHFQMENYEPAQVAAEKAVASTDEPEESWLQMLAALYVLQEDFESVTPVLEELVVRYPKKAYWVQLSLIYGARENYRHSLAVQQIAAMQGYLTKDRELQRLARSYVFAGMPFEAAQVLDDGLRSGSIEPDAKAYEFLANSWIQSREYDNSLEPLRRAAELADNGDLYLRLGQVQMAKEEWTEAAGYFEKAIAKGGLKNPGSAELLLGIALYNDDRVGRARFKFERARRFDKTRKAASDWLKHLDRETQQS